MSERLDHWQEKDRFQSTSVLFNAFIMAQVANEISSRRINNEYDIFSGMFQSPIFISVIAITMGLQAIIINFLGSFFKASACCPCCKYTSCQQVL